MTVAKPCFKMGRERGRENGRKKLPDSLEYKREGWKNSETVKILLLKLITKKFQPKGAAALPSPQG